MSDLKQSIIGKKLAENAALIKPIIEAKAHMEAARRVQVALLQELRDAGVKGEAVEAALVALNCAMSAREEALESDYELFVK